MRVVVTAHVVAGTRRGGEDLFLDFRAEVDFRPNLDDLGEVEIILENDGWEFPRNEDGAAPQTPELRVSAGHYDFSWEGSREDLVALVTPWLRQKHYWSSNFDGDRFTFLHEEYVDGNAD